MEGGIETEIGSDTTYTHTHIHTCTHMYGGHCLFSHYQLQQIFVVQLEFRLVRLTPRVVCVCV